MRPSHYLLTPVFLIGLSVAFPATPAAAQDGVAAAALTRPGGGPGGESPTWDAGAVSEPLGCINEGIIDGEEGECCSYCWDTPGGHEECMDEWASEDGDGPGEEGWTDDACTQVTLPSGEPACLKGGIDCGAFPTAPLSLALVTVAGTYVPDAQAKMIINTVLAQDGKVRTTDCTAFIVAHVGDTGPTIVSRLDRIIL